MSIYCPLCAYNVENKITHRLNLVVHSKWSSWYQCSKIKREKIKVIRWTWVINLIFCLSVSISHNFRGQMVKCQGRNMSSNEYTSRKGAYPDFHQSCTFSYPVIAYNCVQWSWSVWWILLCMCVHMLGACEGTLACSTCHLIFSEEDFNKLPQKPTDEELDMLDLAYGLKDT